MGTSVTPTVSILTDADTFDLGIVIGLVSYFGSPSVKVAVIVGMVL